MITVDSKAGTICVVLFIFMAKSFPSNYKKETKKKKKESKTISGEIALGI